MTTLVRNKPLDTDFMEGFWNRTGFGEKARKKLSSTPAVNIMEKKNSYIIELGAPGFEKKDISISVKNNNLYVRGERNIENDEHDEKYSHREFNINTFNREFQLPTEIDQDHIDAKFLNGMLTMTLPKNKNAASAFRKIEIH